MKKVLIVEDNDLNLKLFKDLLEAQTCSTIETKDGRDAFDMTVREMPDLIIMDIQLPHISGIDIIIRIKGDTRVRHIPVVAITAFAMQDDEDRIRAAGCDAYLSKPIGIESFFHTVTPYLATSGAPV